MHHVSRILLALLLISTAACSPRLATTIYIVRHAEKDLTPGLQDPPLTPAGEQRALALRDSLLPRSVAAIFTTPTSRTRATAAPLAQALHLTPLEYNGENLPELARRIRSEYAGRTVLVVGHSNTILETAEALGAERPVPAIGDKQFDYLLLVKVPARASERPTATARRYGVVR